jgi:hypothetical protein
MVVFLEKYVLPLLVFFAGILLITNPLKWSTNQRIVGGVVDLGAALVVGLLVSSQTRKVGLTPKATAEKPKRTMIPASVTAEDMTAIFGDKRYNTNQARGLTQDFIGKWFQYSGRVHDVYGSVLFFTDPKNEPHMGIVSAWFEKDWVNRISVIPPGKEVKVVGQVGELRERGVVLRRCEIVEDET